MYNSTTKCVCGYEYEYNYTDGQVVKGDKPFIPISIGKDDLRVFYEDRDRRDYYSDGKYEVTIYACPKCGTLKINI